MLIENGLVEKIIYPVVPPKTEYGLTVLGQNLHDIIMAMAELGKLVSEGAGGGKTLIHNFTKTGSH